jgi:uncharacterized radical SAM superfamily Fe-S cluster-containing enzyme
MVLSTTVLAKSNVPVDDTDGGTILPREVESLCSACLHVVPGTLFEENGAVFMVKRCEEHGTQRELISRDARFYRLMFQRDRAILRGVAHPVPSRTGSCPQGCGICPEHQAAPIMMNIDLTNRCNLQCPICFANAGASGQVVELSLDQVRRMLDHTCQTHDVPPSCIQYTGGEPTIHPEFLEALAEAKKRGFIQVQVATNGLKFAHDREFVIRAGEAGLNVAYLQFDGLSDDIYLKTRGRPLLDVKMAAMENLYAAGIRIVLVPTIAKGINDHEIGAITRLAVENTDRISGVSWQPVAFTGRLNYEERLARRFTVADLAREIQAQSGLVDMYRDWYPFGFVDPFSRFVENVSGEPSLTLGCNPACGAATYVVVDSKTNAASAIPAFVDVEPLMQELQSASERLRRGGLLEKLSVTRQVRRLKRFYHADAAPGGWPFEQFVEFMTEFTDFRERFCDNDARMKAAVGSRFRTILMASMHFQDVYNYQLDRVRRCVVHYAAPDGRIYPFCSYNSGPCHRQRVERDFAVPLDEYRAHRQREPAQSR